VAGGGNEKPGSNIGPPPGAIPTLTVSGLLELEELLAATAGGQAPADSPLALGWAAADGVSRAAVQPRSCVF
jgi:hypothetical protein